MKSLGDENGNANTQLNTSKTKNEKKKNLKRGTNWLSEIPNFRFKLTDLSNTGPGRYTILEKSTIPGGCWEETPRFSAGYEKFIKRRKHTIDFSKRKEIEQKNRNMSICTPESRLRNLNESIFKSQVKRSQNYLVKRLNYSQQMDRKKNNLTRKFELFDLRQRKPIRTKHSWLVMITVLGMTQVIRDKSIKKKILKKRIQGYMNLWLRIILSFIQLKRILNKLREKKAKMTIFKFVPKFKGWFYNRRGHCRRILINILEESLLKSKLFNLMNQFKSLFLRSQRRIKDTLIIRRIRISLIKKIWLDIEFSLGHKSNKYRLSDQDRKLWILKYYKHQVRVYSKMFRQYSSEYNTMKAIYEMSKKEKEILSEVTGKSIELEDVSFPKKPCLVLYSNKQLIKEYVLSAIKYARNRRRSKLKVSVNFSPKYVLRFIYLYLFQKNDIPLYFHPF